MADSTVVALTAATTLDGTELYYGVQAGGDVKITGAQIKTLVLTPGGSNTQVQFNDSSAFGGDAGLTFTKATSALAIGSSAGANLTVNYSGSGAKLLATLEGSNVNGSGGTAGWSFTVVDGLSSIKSLQGSSGGGFAFRDFNDGDLLCLGRQIGGFGGGYWSIQGTNNTSIGDLGPGTDNTSNIGDATHNVKTIHSYTNKLKPVTFANVPASPLEGMTVSITDSTTATWGATITGSGANHVLGYYNGTNWTVAAK